MNEILFLSSLLVGVSGIFLIAGFLEHKKAMEIMENLSDGSVKYERHEGTDSE